jgi:CheY-like chemotaxis protein
MRESKRRLMRRSAGHCAAGVSGNLIELKDGLRGVWKRRMEIARRQSILIIEPNEQLREEIVNFLLSAGYEDVAATDSLPSALDKLRQSEYEVTIADAGRPLTTGLQFAAELASLKPGARIIFMINAEDQQSWDQISAQSVGSRFLIKTDFARNLLYLLEEGAQP